MSFHHHAFNLEIFSCPRSLVQLPDPFTPNLKVDLLPEIGRPPRILSNCVIALSPCLTRAGGRMPPDTPPYLLPPGPPEKLLDANTNNDHVITSYSVPLVNSLVVHVGMTAISQLHTKSGNLQQPIAHSTRGCAAPHEQLGLRRRYFLLNANQLRYPNNHTHYFSCVLLYLC